MHPAHIASCCRLREKLFLWTTRFVQQADIVTDDATQRQRQRQLCELCFSMRCASVLATHSVRVCGATILYTFSLCLWSFGRTPPPTGRPVRCGLTTRMGQFSSSLLTNAIYYLTMVDMSRVFTIWKTMIILVGPPSFMWGGGDHQCRHKWHKITFFHRLT